MKKQPATKPKKKAKIKTVLARKDRTSLVRAQKNIGKAQVELDTCREHLDMADELLDSAYEQIDEVITNEILGLANETDEYEND
jgi:hypothetical protein